MGLAILEQLRGMATSCERITYLAGVLSRIFAQPQLLSGRRHQHFLSIFIGTTVNKCGLDGERGG